MSANTDQIEKTVTLHAPIDRVWRAIADSREFGRWFGARFDGPFEPGARVCATIHTTEIDAEVAAAQQQYAGLSFFVWVETMEAPRRLAFRWHPGGGPDAATADTPDGTTLVTFELEEVAGGTRLTIRETGFSVIALEQRASAIAENESGWESQMRLLAKYLDME